MKDNKEITKMLSEILDTLHREIKYLEEIKEDSQKREVEVFESDIIPIPENVYKEICLLLKSDKIYFMAIS